MRTFYRIETLNMDEGGSPVGGYMRAVDAMLCIKLGISPKHTAEELHKAVNSSDDPDVQELMVCMSLLCDIPIPDIYKENQDNMYCLYNKAEYDEAVYILNRLRGIMIDTIPAYAFRHKKFKLSDDEIVYEDPYQVVITKEIYDKHYNDSKYRII